MKGQRRGGPASASHDERVHRGTRIWRGVRNLFSGYELMKAGPTLRRTFIIAYAALVAFTFLLMVIYWSEIWGEAEPGEREASSTLVAIFGTIAVASFTGALFFLEVRRDSRVLDVKRANGFIESHNEQGWQVTIGLKISNPGHQTVAIDLEGVTFMTAGDGWKQQYAQIDGAMMTTGLAASTLDTHDEVAGYLTVPSGEYRYFRFALTVRTNRRPEECTMTLPAVSGRGATRTIEISSSEYETTLAAAETVKRDILGRSEATAAGEEPGNHAG